MAPPTMGKHAQEEDNVREGGGAGLAAWFRPAGEVIAQHDADFQWARANARELYTSAKARASAVTKQEEDLAVRA
jgi:hypothetical protein